MTCLPITDPLPEIHLCIKAAEMASKAVMKISIRETHTS